MLTPTEVLIYNCDNLKLTVSNEAVLRGWRDKYTGLWEVPLKESVNNIGEDTILLNRSDPKEAMHNVYGLPSTEKTILYLHACTGHPTKSTWLAAIRAGNYLSWPLLTATAVSKHFPE